jgi:hypothetical protein
MTWRSYILQNKAHILLGGIQTDTLKKQIPYQMPKKSMKHHAASHADAKWVIVF